MNGHKKEQNSGGSKEEQVEFYAPAKRFVFDIHVPNNISIMESEPSEISKICKNTHLQKYLPIIQEFIPPKDYKTAYQTVCEHILGVYSEIRELILTETISEIQETLKGIKIEGPNDCLKLLKTLSVKYCVKEKEVVRKEKVQKTVGKYEKLVQDSELQVRELIRNEQIYRLNFDQLIVKNEDAERNMADLNERLQEDRILIESLTKETARLTAMTRQKDEEIRSLRMECQAAQHQIESLSPIMDSPPSVERYRAKNLSCTSQNLRMLLNDGRLTPTDFSARMSSIRKSSTGNRTPNSAKMKALPKAGTLLDLTSGSSKNTKGNGFDKIKEVRDSLRNQITIFTERKKNGSSTPAINQGGALDSINFFASARGLNQQIIIPEQTNAKQAIRIKSKKEGYATDEKSQSPVLMKAKHQEEFANILGGAESFEKAERRKDDETERKGSSKIELLDEKNRRRAGVTRARPPASEIPGNVQKSFEHKNSLSNTKQASQPVQRGLTKSKSIVFDTKSAKVVKNSGNPLMNIMLKKFSEHELGSKKVY